MSAINWETTRQIWDAIEKHQGSESGATALRILKLNEEIGEVSQAFIGLSGANRRKGFTHTKEDVAKELVDVIITAMVALEDYVIMPEQFFDVQLQRVRERVREQGS